MTRKKDICKTSIMLVISLTFFMMAAASANAEGTEEVIPRPDGLPVEDTATDDLTDDLVISPNPDVAYDDQTDDLLISPSPEPSLIEPYADTINEETGEPDNLVVAGDTTQEEASTTVIPGVAILAVVAGMVVVLIILKRSK